MSGLRDAVRTGGRGLTTRGRCLLSAGLVLAAAGLLLGQRDLLRVGTLLLALVVAADLLVARSRYRLTCSRVLDPPQVGTGRPSTVRLRLHNVSRLTSSVLLLEESLPGELGPAPRFALDRVEPGARREVTYTVRAEVRGHYPVGPLSLRLRDPFGLCELTRSFAGTDRLVVTPQVSTLPAVRLGGDWVGGGETTSQAVTTTGSDDAAVREYRHGDDLRKVHWRSTARVGELMVRREEQPFQSRATLLLDNRTAAHRGHGPASSLEWSVSAVASIGVSLIRGGFTVHVVDADGLPLAPGAVPFTERILLDALAGVRPSRSPGLEAAVRSLRAHAAAGVTVAVVGMLEPADAQRLARLRQGAGACAAVAVDSDSWAPVSAAGRHRALQAYESTRELLLLSGWRVGPAAHGTLLAAAWAQLGTVRPPVPVAGRP